MVTLTPLCLFRLTRPVGQKRRQRKNTKIENSTSKGIAHNTEKVKAESLLGKFVILVAKVFFPHDNLLDRHGTH